MASKFAISTYCANLTPALAMSKELTPVSIIRKESQSNYVKAMTLVLIRLTEWLNVANSLSDDQMIDIAVRISKDYYFLRLEEILLCFYEVSSGNKTYALDYNRLDSAKVMNWIETYDVQRRTPVVREAATQKVDERTAKLDDKQYADFLERVAAGKKTEVTPETRVSTNNTDAQTAARLRYLKEKADGTVKDYTDFEELPNE